MKIIMDSKYQPQLVEEKIYKEWESKGYFKANVNNPPAGGKKPFSIILPPPNANANLHLGHAMYVYEDIMIRYKKLSGFGTLWFPGADHAGIETQYVFEKFLQKQDKSRFDYDRKTLFQMIWKFVMENRSNMENQLRRLGFALDWEKKKFTMDEDIVNTVYQTFKKLFDQGLLYRDYRLVNYCTRCGTSFSDLEVVYVERNNPLYYMKYGPFTIATVRPETKFRDTAMAINPKDKRYRQWLGKTLEIPGLLGPIKMKIIADPEVDPKFGTGIMKVTPAHDPHDFELGKKYNLPVIPIITTQGRMDFSWFLSQKNIPEKYRFRAEEYHHQKVAKARALIVDDLKEDGLLVKTNENYTHRIGTCYRDGSVIEPLPLEQWFIKVKPLVAQAKKLVKTGKIKVHPKRFEKHLFRILDNFIDWNISRQIVWGIRIPAYKCKAENSWFISLDPPKKCEICGRNDFEQDEDTFDTWFSSAQWPFATLMTEGQETFDYFYPTSVMETGHDILRAWVARMIMIGYFATGKPPFENIFLHGMVRDRKGQKMSKSKGNVINPLEVVDKFGADALRAALVFGVKEGGDVPFSEEKVVGMRNFINKIWNIGRFIKLNNKVVEQFIAPTINGAMNRTTTKTIINDLKKEYKKEKKQYIKYMDGYQFSKALGLVYEFIWHRFADFYIEQLKDEIINGNIEALKELKEVYLENLKMLHPFIPFVTETVWKVFNNESILTTSL